ncbi:methylmalonyl Co-A mutase-associated GTPase MeaB [Aurantibacter sp.]|uniref:methylmalonyl Co-A mutase-associated GTPase MeaB n=1 Tax=Aurantibacter sp. TaxID=2807103 RepID=UPI0035C81C65
MSHKKSALNETSGVNNQNTTSNKSISKIRAKRRKNIDEVLLTENILKGNITALSQAITLIESKNSKHKTKAKYIINKCLPEASKSVRLGITGVPGVGKSTFIEALGKLLISKGHKVAILAVDPSSSVTKGSILGDKTRMEDLVKDPDAFIRPSASGDTLGGVAQHTRESVILCEAAGYDVIIIETVGVGQSETVVHSMVDFFLLLKLAGAGDELQGIKRGIIEMADSIVINKADGENIKAAKLAKVEFNRALHFYPEKESKFQPKVLLTSAIKDEGIQEVWDTILNYVKITKTNNNFESKRQEQNNFWLLQTISDALKNDFFSNANIKSALDYQKELVASNKTTPFDAAKQLLDLFYKEK